MGRNKTIEVESPIMKSLSTAILLLAVLVNHSEAQTSFNPDWYHREGLSVGSYQTVTVQAKTLRGFTSIEVVDREPREAIARLKVARKSAIEAIKKAIGVSDGAIKASPAMIAEWGHLQKGFGMWSREAPTISPTELDEYTAATHLCFDMTLKSLDEDELAILPHDVYSRLKKQPEFESSDLVFLYVGEVSDEQAKQATKRAYDEAFDNAKKLTALSSRSLGKLVELTAGGEGSSRYWFDLGYGNFSNDNLKSSPLANFKPLANEVFGSNPAELTRVFSVDLRFEIE